ncbi:hypothetical protein Scani_48090 [Streptomyces caniferus]|uniref:Uncharacterized protein n=1 Tax=Streptomyces caniferus TaxID=285557 RepID=A0A640SDN4_9ACTN|nr:hypothetical protein [Streptomyces caniferus]GFE08541.1 hypothetical protein Scani_48090 [Streptomyces caniferus]
MATTVPTADDVQALSDFMLQRADEEWEATIGDDALDPDAMARLFRVSNSNKLAITSTTRCLVHLLARYEVDQAALTWHHLTAAGEEWRSHPDYLPVWENAQRAQIRQQLEG